MKGTIALTMTLFLFATGSASVSAASLNDWLSARLTTLVAKTNSSTKQTEAPRASGNATSLVDQSSAADLFSFALNQAGLSIGEEADDTASATATLYALYAAFQGADPLKPEFYNKHAALRRVSFTVGVDEENQDDESEEEGGEDTGEEEAASGTSRLYGLKWLIYDGRNLNRDDNDLSSAISDAAFAQSKGARAVSLYLFTRPSMQETVRSEYQQFLEAQAQEEDGGCLAKEAREDGDDDLELMINRLVDRLIARQLDRLKTGAESWSRCEKEYWPEWVNAHAGTSFDETALSEEDLAEIDQILADNIDAIAALSDKTKAALDRIRRAPQFSLVTTYKDLPGAGRVYLGEATFDYGLRDRLTLTLNAGYESTDLQNEEDREDTWRVAGQFRYQLSAETLTRKATYFDLAGEAKGADEETTYKIQAKATVPLAAGLSLPLSLTYASDTELIEEDEIRGQLGFSIDASKLIEALQGGGTLFGNNG